MRVWGGALCLCLACDVASNPLAGIDFTSVAVAKSSPNVIYAASNAQVESGIFRSDDGGKTWRLLADWFPASTQKYRDKPTRLAISPTDPDAALFGTMSETFRTTDGGRSWSRVLDQGVSRVAFHPAHDDRAFMLESGGELAISADRGATWTLQKTSAATPVCVLPLCFDFTFDGADPNRMYAACGSEGVFVSTDSGACWSPTSPQGADIVIASPHDGGDVWVGATDGIYASQDGAATFTLVTSWSPVYGLTTGAFADSPTGPVLLFGTSSIGIIGVRADASIADLGATLVRRADAIDEIVSTPSGLYLAGSSTCRGNAGVFKSTNQGTTWDSVLLGQPFPPLDGPIGDAVPHELMIIFYRDVSVPRQMEIMAEHNVTPEYPKLTAPLYFVHTDPSDPRSVSDLLREFQAIDEVDCCLNDFYMTSN